MRKQRWRFGVGQTAAQERAEIAAAQRAGRTKAYLAGQAHRRAIEAETARRRAVKAERRRRAARRAS